MKKVFTLKNIIIALGAVSVTVVGSIFLIMYANRYADSNAATVETSKQNAFVITPKNMGSYGELMFAYIGKDNYLYNLDDESKPLIEQPASLLLYASDDTVIYTASAETDAAHYGRESVIQELQINEKGNILNTIATVSVDPCWSSNDEVVYFVRDNNRKQLCTFEPLTSTTEMAAEFDENITGLRISSDGLLVTTDSGSERLYVPLSKQLTDAYYDSQGSRVIVCEQYDLILTPDGTLSYRWLGSNEAVKVAEHVTVTCGYQDNEILYIQQDEEGLSLNAFFVSEEQTEQLARLSENMLPQLTVSADYAFVIDDCGLVYRLNLDDKRYEPFCKIKDEVKNPMIAVFDYRLMVYDLANEIDRAFCYAVNAGDPVDEKTAEQLLRQQEAAVKERPPEFAEYSTLEMGSIGADVSTLQSKLLELGYTSAEPSGIFDVNTTVAVQYAQDIVQMDASGVATPEFQQKLLSGEIPPYKDYWGLSVTSRGIRVRDAQARLRTLGYQKEPVTAEINAAATAGLKRYATQNGLEYSGVFKPSDLKLLFDTAAVKYRGHLALSAGDRCDAVTDLNARLKKLNYLSGAVNPVYDGKTTAAVTLFQEVNGMTASGTCDSKTLEALYSDKAPTCPKDRAPAAADELLSVNKGQTISDRQLKIIRKWLTKQFAVNHTDKQAVKRLQMQLVKLGLMKADMVSMIYDQNTMNAVKKIQTNMKLEADGVASKNTLKEIFNKTIKNSTLG